MKKNYTNIVWIILVHLIAILAIPYFTWAYFWVVVVGVFILAPLGINMGYHRLLTHRGFQSSRLFTRVFVTLGAMLGGGPPIHWATSHRLHHKFSDRDGDPHDSRKGFWYAHVLHLFEVSDQERTTNESENFAPDLKKDPYLLWLNKYWIWTAVATIPICYFIGGIGLVLWGVFFRLALMWHIMWFVNSASHFWGYRTYPTHDHTRNNWWVGILAAGEGWHNNHHAFPSCVAHGRRWWEVDLTYFMICGFEKLGWVSNVKHPVESVRTTS